MAIKYANAIDLGKNELQNARVQNLSSAPGTPVEGQVYHNTTDHKLYVWNGSAWADLGRIYVHPNHTGDVTSVGDGAQTIGASKVTNAQLAVMTANGLKGNNTGSSTNPADLTPAQVMALLSGAAGADFALNGKKITGVADPTAAQDAATKNYVDSVAQGLDAKPSVLLATTGPISLTGTPTAVIDGVTVPDRARVLVKDQASPAENGIYDYCIGLSYRRGSGYVPDADTWDELRSAFVFVEQGAVNADTGWVCTIDAGGTFGVTAITWAQFSGAGNVVITNVGAGASVFKDQVGNTYNLRRLKSSDATLSMSAGAAATEVDIYLSTGMVTDSHIHAANKDGAVGTASMRTIGAGAQQAAAGNHTHGYQPVDGDLTAIAALATTGIVRRTGTDTWSAGTTVSVAEGGTGAGSAAAARTNLGAIGKYAANCTASASQTITAATHGLGAGQDKTVQIYTVASTYDKVEADVQINATSGDVTIVFAVAPAAGQYRIVIMG